MFVKEKDEMGNGREQYRKMLERFEGVGKLAQARETWKFEDNYLFIGYFNHGILT